MDLKSQLETEMVELLKRDMYTHEHYRFQDDIDDFEYNRLYRLYRNFEADMLYCHHKEIVVYYPDDLQAVCECDDCSFCDECPALRLDNIYKLENK